MMWKQVFTVLLVATPGAAFSPAQDDASKVAQTEVVAADRNDSDADPRAGDDAVLKAVEAEFRELVCAQASDPSDASQDLAIDIVIQRGYVDERFNDLIRKTMKTASKPYHWDVEQLSRAEQLLSVSTLKGKERTELAFRCYMMCGDKRADQSLARALRQRMDVEPDETSRLVKQRMLQDEFTPELLSLVPIVGESSESMLPMLMKAAKSGDRALSEEAMGLIPDLIDRLREFNEQKREVASMRNALKSVELDQLDPKLIIYAKRLISRYDQDGDLRLSPGEYGKMLMSPESADIDSDGAITVEEYAVWMQSRSRR